ncbi:hypothetical protein EP7_004627 [Isosphaeraceae bacterium EP7]
MNQPGILIPPRPLPGLEGYPAARTLPLWGVSAALAIAAFASIWWFRRRRHEPRRAAAPSIRQSQDVEGELTHELVARVRNALVTRFGAGWSARTTEEIAASTELAAILGDDLSRMLIAWLAEHDQFRFAPNRGTEDEPRIPPGPWLQDILNRLGQVDGVTR